MRQKNQSCTFSAIDWSLSIADWWPTFLLMPRGKLLTITTRSARRWWIWWLYSHLYTNGYLLVLCLYFSRWNVLQPRWKELFQSVLCQLIIKLLVYLSGVFLQALNDLPVSCHCINLTNSFLCKTSLLNSVFTLTVKCIPSKVRSLPLQHLI